MDVIVNYQMPNIWTVSLVKSPFAESLVHVRKLPILYIFAFEGKQALQKPVEWMWGFRYFLDFSGHEQ